MTVFLDLDTVTMATADEVEVGLQVVLGTLGVVVVDGLVVIGEVVVVVIGEVVYEGGFSGLGDGGITGGETGEGGSVI
jgi:hypothetical protein